MNGREPQVHVPPQGRWPWQRSLQVRIILTYGLAFLVILLLLAVVVGQIIYRTQLNTVENDLELAAFLAANALEDPLSGYKQEFAEFKKWENERDHDDETAEAGDDEATPAAASTTAANDSLVLPRLQQVAMVYASDADARVTILDPRGHPVADSYYHIQQIENQIDQIEVQAALAGSEQHDVRLDPLSGEQTLFAAAPIQQGSDLLGVVQMSRPMAAIMQSIWRVEMQLLGAGLAALLIASLLGVWIGRRLVRPVRQLEAAALATAGGDLGQQVEVDRADELGALAFAFNFMVDELRRMLEQQQAFVANASHELRTPLTNIKLRSETLLSLGSERPDISERYLTEIDSEADRLGRLAATLLDLSRLERTQEQKPPQESVDVAPIVREVVDTMQLRAGQAGVALSLEMEESIPPLCIWPEQVEAILVNLVDNAIKYTPTGGEVCVIVRAQDGEVLLSVQDSGPGIPEADLPRVFEPFYQVNKARSRRRDDHSKNGFSSGAGLGLSIVKTLVEQNGGRIEASQPAQGGSQFVVTFSHQN